MLLKGTVKLCTGIIQIHEILIYCRILGGISENKKIKFRLVPCCLAVYQNKPTKYQKSVYNLNLLN